MTGLKVFNNAKWIVACKIVQSLLQLVIGMISARYLGPSNYGIINYAASLVAFVLPIMQLGLRAILVQEYVLSPAREGEIMGTCLLMNLTSAIACMLGVIGFALVANHGDKTTIIVCALYSTTMLFQVLEMQQCWFQARLLSKYSSLASLIAYVVVSAYKIYLLVAGKSVYWFALSHAVEYCAVGALMFVSYKKLSRQKLSVSLPLAKSMFAKSKYYIVAFMMSMVYANTDHVMLQNMIGASENGYYSAAYTCTGVVAFVYSAIIDSARPVILESKQKSQGSFERNVVRLYAIVCYICFAQSLCFTVWAKLIVYILYGAEYNAAVPVLRILVWQLAFSYMGSVRNIWILAEEKYSLLWRINMAGAISNVILNAVLIPHWGACGAAFASVVTQIITNFVVGFILKPIRENNRLLMEGLRPRALIEVLVSLYQMIKKKDVSHEDQ